MNDRMDVQEAKKEAISLLNFWLNLRKEELKKINQTMKSINQRIVEIVVKGKAGKGSLRLFFRYWWSVIHAKIVLRLKAGAESRVKAVKTALAGLEKPIPDPNPAIKLLSEAIHFSSISSNGIDSTISCNDFSLNLIRSLSSLPR